MNNSKIFRFPLIRSISSVTEEKIYSFNRRVVYSPGTTGNSYIKFCTVTGACGAESQSHTHSGDELVFTLEGENTNYSGGNEFTLQQNQAIAIPPGTEHTTKVANIGTWKGISFYCDNCPLINKYQYEMRGNITKKNMATTSSCSSEYLEKQTIFSPTLKESLFMELFALSSDTPVRVTEFKHKGETVYYTISGNVLLSWGPNEMLLEPGMAAAIPAGFPHKLKPEDSNGCKILAGSCSSCPLMEFKTD